ncbi:MAG TPA: hypothetical protein DDW19_01850 [Anaerolineaceae bacterium]|jgi:hypothetical protein|nr:hypothetical protein [Anaerolineaceae bacterium]
MIAKAVYEVLTADKTLTAMLGTYEGDAAIFTIDPAPGDAVLPYIVAAAVPVQTPFDSKTTRGRTAWIDIRCYTGATGSAQAVDAIAERVRALLHREPLLIDDHIWLWSECTGPVSANEAEAYGRIVTLKVTFEEL